MRGPVDRLTEGLPKPWRVAIDWIVTIVGAVAIVLAIKAWVVNPYRIPSSSMEPTLHCARGELDCEAKWSDRVLANRFKYHFVDPARGDIVVFQTPKPAQDRCGAGGTFVKRIIGLPGEIVTVEESTGAVLIDGKKLDESSYIERDQLAGQETGQWEVPKRQYFVMGDNRNQSCDSRQWGSLDRGNLIGEVFAVYWPPDRIGPR
ncbi:MAG: signal peptidase I [Gaiellaceae bacterium]